MRRSRSLVPVALALATGLLVLSASACGSDDGGGSVPQSGNVPTTQAETTTSATSATEGEGGDGSTTTGSGGADEGAFPLTVEAANGPVELAARPRRIVSLSPTATEMLYAIGAADQVAAVDGESDQPGGTPMSGTLSAATPSIDAILAQQPDLVLVHTDNAGVVGGLAERRVPVLHLPAAEKLDDSYAQLEQLGRATGHGAEATTLVEKMKGEVQQLLAQVPARPAPVRIYHEIDGDLFTTTSASFIGELYRLAGLENIADGTGDGNGYPQLSSDRVLDRNPDWIFVAHAAPGTDALGLLAARSGWTGIRAIQANQVVQLDPEIASRWGPRTVELLRTILAATTPATTTVAAPAPAPDAAAPLDPAAA
jgi:iron complex transport system substrate-binding protein